MIDYETLQRLSYALQDGISAGMRDGAEHIAAALAKPAPGPDVDGGVNGAVPVHEVLGACRVLVGAYTAERRVGEYVILCQPTVYAPNGDRVRAAFSTLRKALGMPA